MTCDRACLIDKLHAYMAALTAKDPRRAPLAAHVRFTENDEEMPIGEGLWGSISGASKDGLELADPLTGQAAWFGLVYEHGQPAYYALRLKVEDQRITEVETVVDRQTGLPAPFGDVSKYSHDPAFSEVLPAVSLTTATPLSGTDKVKAAPVVLNGQLVVGDRAGNVIQYNYTTAAKRVTSVNYGWPIEAPIAVDVDDNLTITDLFACAGGQMEWVKPDGTLYMGQYALVEKGAADGTLVLAYCSDAMRRAHLTADGPVVVA